MNVTTTFSNDAGIVAGLLAPIRSDSLIVPALRPFGRQAALKYAEPQAVVREIAFIDCNVADFDKLLAGMRPGVEAVLLYSSQRATAQMATVLREYGSLDAIHVIAHGRPGEVSFAAGALTLENLHEHGAYLKAVGMALGREGKLLFWSCESGQGPRGSAFIDALSAASGVPVAAATGLVGAAALGGAWRLEAPHVVDAPRSPLTDAAMAAYPGVMADREAMTITTVSDDVLPKIGALNSGDSTNDPNLTMRLTFSPNGIKIQAGDTIKLFNNGSTQLGSTYTVTGADITRGYADVQTGALTDGVTYAITAQWFRNNTDSLVSTVFTITEDRTAPAAVATVTALSADGGASSTDFITNVASQTVSGTYTGTLGSSEKIQVSANGGATWVNATAGANSWSASVTLTGGANNLSVRTIDAADNVTAGTGRAYTLDTAAPTALATVTALSADTGSSGTDFITSVASQTVTGAYTGTLGSGETIQVSADGGGTWVNATAGANTWSASVTLTAGGSSLSVRTVDTAGNAVAGTGHSYALDASGPAAVATVTALSADNGSSNADFVTNTANQTVSGTYTGTLAGGEAIQVSVDGNTWVNATAGANTWSAAGITLSGSGNLGVRTLDAAGNVTAGTGHAFTLDTAAPAAPSVALSADSGTAGDGITNDGALNVTGLEAGATLEYSTNGGTAWTPGFTAAEGANSVQVRQTDVAGNVSLPGAAFSFTLDTQAPAAPSVALAADTGVAGDGITKDGILNVTGVAAGATVQYSIDYGANWTASFTAAEGLNTVQVRQTDAAGNASAAASLSFTLDSTAGMPIVALASDSGVAGDGITNSGAVDVSGLEAGAAVEYSINGGSTWTSSFTAAEGANSVQVRQTDIAGNQSPAASLSFMLDTAAAAPSVTLTTDSGAAGDGITNDGALAVTGLETGATVEYSTNGGTTWTPGFTAAEGANSVQVRQTDVAGNVSLPSAAFAFTLDTQAPAAPSVALAADSGVAGDGITKDGALSVTGLVAGATVQYSIDNGANWTASFTAAEGPNTVQVRQTDTAGNASAAASLSFTLDSAAAAPSVALASDSGVAGDGITSSGALDVTGLETGAAVEYSINGGSTWTANFTAAEGANTVQVRQTDIAGNQSAAASLSFTLDTAAAPPTVALAADSGIAGDGITNDGELDVTGLEAGATVEYSTNGGTAWTPGFTAAEGANSVQVRQTDVAGNVSQASAAFSFTLDTQAPAAPTVALAADSGIAGDGITKDGTLGVTGVAAGATVQYSIDNGANWTASFTAAEGPNTVQVRQTDAAGNASAAASLSFTLDSTAAAPSVALATDSGVAGDGITNSGALDVTGLETGATVQYSTDNGANWTPGFTAAEGLNSVQVRQTDVAGNASGAASLSFTLDSTAAAPSVALAVDSGVAGDGITNNGALNVTGLETGATVQYSIDNGASWTPGFTAAAGANSVQVRQTDVAGNVSLPSAAFAFTLNTQAPAAPQVALASESGIAGDGITKSGALNVTGLVAGATVQYSTDNGANWTPGFTATEGPNAVQVRQTDVAGNASAAASLSFTLDSTAAAPAVALVADSGVAGDGVTNNGALSVTGLETGATVQYSIDNGAHWTASFTPVQGLNTVQVRQTDIAGNQSTAATLSFTYDTAAAAPSVALAVDSGVAGDGITNDATLNITGLETGASVQYSIDNGAHWTSSFTAVAGANSVQVKQTDVAGNQSAAASLSFTLNTQAPTAPGVALTTDSGVSSSDRITNVGALSLTGVAAGASVQYNLNGSATWTPTFTAVEGSNAVQVRQTDIAGNVSLPSAAYNFTLDTLAPAAPGNVDMSATAAGIAITGTAENLANVTLFNDIDNDGIVDSGEALGSMAAPGGAFSFEPALASGTYNLKTVAADAAGNVSGASQAMAVYVGGLYSGAGGSTFIVGTSGDNGLNGTAGNDKLFGLAGNDILSGADGNDLIYGQGGNDLIFGGAGVDTIFGGAGNDVAYGGAGNDVFTGGEGSDTLSFISITDGKDTFTDFTIGNLDAKAGAVNANADVFDLSTLMQDVNSLGSAVKNDQASKVAKYIHFEVSGTTATMFVDMAGKGAGVGLVSFAVIVGTNGDALLGQLLGNNQIVV